MRLIFSKLVLLLLLISLNKVGFSQKNYLFSPTLSIGTDFHLGTFKSLNTALKSSQINQKINNNYLHFGLGYSLEYYNVVYAPKFKVGVNVSDISQYTLNWNLINLGYILKLNEKVHLKPYVGWGVVHHPLVIQLSDQATSLSQLRNDANAIHLKYNTGYFNLGVEMRDVQLKTMAISYGMQWDFNFTDAHWRNGTQILQDISPSRLNRLSFHISISKL